MDAIRVKNICSLKQLITGQHIDFQYCTLSPLISSVIKGDFEITQILLNHGADPNYISDINSPLVYAIFQNNIEIVQTLLNYCANPNLVAGGKHPILEVLKCGGKHLESFSIEILNSLLEKGGNPCAQIRGTNALGFAVLSNNAKAISVLESFGAKHVLINDVFYDSVYSFAYEFNPSFIRKITTRHIEIINHFKTMPRIISRGKEVVMGGIDFLEVEEKYIRNQLKSRAFEAANIAIKKIKII